MSISNLTVVWGGMGERENTEEERHNMHISK